MSSPEEDLNCDLASQLKKRKVLRACDFCRRKKVRCDGGLMPDNRCTNCVVNKSECTYIEGAPKKRTISKSYVEDLENRLQKMESLFRRLSPNIDITQELTSNFDARKQDPQPVGSIPSERKILSTSSIPPPMAFDADDIYLSDDDLTAHETLENSLKQMQINPTHVPFFGKASTVMLVPTAMEAKEEYTGIERAQEYSCKRRELHTKRPQFWDGHPWVVSPLPSDSSLEFPDDDLMFSLIDLYFLGVNDFMPILHRPTFEKDIRECLHYRDEGFASVVLLVCALGSRFSDDPRVFLEGSDSTNSCGWAWFSQVQLVRKSLLTPPKLSQLQYCCLSALFLYGTSTPHSCWTIIGFGLRLAQDVGAHRRKLYHAVSTVEEELWKRAFWVLVSLDRISGLSLGRTCAIQDEDFDLDPPTECDDEYWEIIGPNCQFKQPDNKPSKISFFNCLLRLNQILAFALRTIYSINKSKAVLGFVGQKWEQHIVAELDSALNKWVDSVPEHLRWDPSREDELFLNQSAFLYASYYQLQIAVHRPFIPSPRKPSPLSFPSLAICTNAARSCTHVLDVPFRRGYPIMVCNLMILFTCGTVLLLNIWGGKRSGLSIDPVKEMDDVHKCMKMLKTLESRWHLAGRLWDILYDLASVGDLPLPQASPSPSNNKRERDADIPSSTNSMLPTASTSFASPGEPRDISGSRRVSQRSASASHEQQQQWHCTPQMPLQNLAGASSSSFSPSFPLPMHTEDLGRLPLHPGYEMDHLTNSEWMSTYQVNSYTSSSQVAPATATAAAAMGVDPGLDPSMATILSMTSRRFSQSEPSAVSFPFSAYSDVQDNTIGLGTLPVVGESGISGTALDDSSLDFSDDTLTMWSNAPQVFEWDDWGSFVNSVSGLDNVNPSKSSDGRC